MCLYMTYKKPGFLALGVSGTPWNVTVKSRLMVQNLSQSESLTFINEYPALLQGNKPFGCIIITMYSHSGHPRQTGQKKYKNRAQWVPYERRLRN